MLPCATKRRRSQRRHHLLVCPATPAQHGPQGADDGGRPPAVDASGANTVDCTGGGGGRRGEDIASPSRFEGLVSDTRVVAGPSAPNADTGHTSSPGRSHRSRRALLPAGPTAAASPTTNRVWVTRTTYLVRRCVDPTNRPTLVLCSALVLRTSRCRDLFAPLAHLSHETRQTCECPPAFDQGRPVALGSLGYLPSVQLSGLLRRRCKGMAG